MDEQPGFVVEGERVALGPLRLDLVPTYQRWENDLEVANGNGRVMPFTLEAERDRIAGRGGMPDCLDFTVYDRAEQTPIGWSTLARIDHRNGTAEFGIHLGERRGRGLGTEATLLTLDWGSPCSACTTSCWRPPRGTSGPSGSIPRSASARWAAAVARG